MARVYEVTAYLPATVSLSKRTSKDTITVQIQGGGKPGTLVISQGTVEWWPEHNKSIVYRGHWDLFGAMCEEHLKRRTSTKKSKRPKK
jgi:hypothetical protein